MSNLELFLISFIVICGIYYFLNEFKAIEDDCDPQIRYETERKAYRLLHEHTLKENSKAIDKENKKIAKKKKSGDKS
jgi:hypothetical protein